MDATAQGTARVSGGTGHWGKRQQTGKHVKRVLREGAVERAAAALVRSPA